MDVVDARTAPSRPTLRTVGHSTLAMEAFVEVLRAHGIRRLVDVRAHPGSRRHPHFGRDHLAQVLPAHGIAYDWMGDSLGGRRRAREDSPNAGIRDPGLRGYADHMETTEFRDAIDRLLEAAAREPTAVMCAEKLWWRCHRSLLADYVVLTGRAAVLHLLDAQRADPHRPKAEARRVADGIRYDASEPPSLFGDGGSGAGG